MKKGKFGFYLWVYPIVGLIFAAMSELVPCMLVAGFAICTERDGLTSKKVLEAFFLCLASKMVRYIPTAFVSLMTSSDFLGRITVALFCVFNALVVITACIEAGIGIVNALRGRRAGVPGFSWIAEQAFTGIDVQLYRGQMEKK